MIAISGQVRIVLATAQLLTTMGAMAVGGVGVAVGQERQLLARGQAELGRADQHFQQVLAASLRDGTPSAALLATAHEEWLVWHTSRPRAFMIDRLLLDDLHQRTAAIELLVGRVQAAQRGAEEALAGQLAVALGGLGDDLATARRAGVPNADELDQRGAEYRPWATDLVIPTEAAERLRQVALLDIAVRNATTAKVAADHAAAEASAAASAAAAAAASAAAAAAASAAEAALRAAMNDAAYQHDRAHTALGLAQTIPVLQVADVASAIAALDGRPAPQSAAGFEGVAGAYAAQARRLNDLMYIRRMTYAQLSTARVTDGRAAAMGIDVTSFTARLDAANAQLDAAGDVPSILAAADAVRNVQTAIDAAISYARAHPPPPPGSVVLNVPYFAQIYSLSCEEASLQMALAYEGINANQDTILATIGVDRTAPQLDAYGNVIHWGDPYASFVGDPNGYREGAQYGDRSGYGTYDTAIARAATALGGHVLRADERIPPADLYEAINQHHPSVAWVAWQYSPHGTTTYQAWDGRVVMYGAPWEHAVTLIGVSPASVLINNPHGGQEWVAKSTFEAAYGMFDQMAVILN